MKQKPGTYLLSTEDSDEGLEQCRKYIADNGLTQDDVKMLRHKDSVNVVAKREVNIK